MIVFPAPYARPQVLAEVLDVEVPAGALEVPLDMALEVGLLDGRLGGTILMLLLPIGLGPGPLGTPRL